MQKFKDNDPIESKVIAAGENVTTGILLDRDEFYEDAYEAQDLGAVIWDSKRSPLANAIQRDIFIRSFNQLFLSFQNAGTFESYLMVFRKIFGDSVVVAFTVPAAGKLLIDITAPDIEVSTLVARLIELNQFVYYPILTQDGDNIVLSSIQGFTSQYDLEQMLFEMVPGGIYTVITLSLS